MNPEKGNLHRLGELKKVSAENAIRDKFFKKEERT